MATKKKPNLPPAGTAFAFPIGDGRYSVCRVLLDNSSEQSKSLRFSTDPILVACSAWIGDGVPLPDDPELRPILRPTHHVWEGKPWVLWVYEEPPQDFFPLGLIDPTPEEQMLETTASGLWDAITIQPLMQWRWDHDRVAVLAEDAAREREDFRRKEKTQLDREAYLNSVTFEDLRSRVFFGSWERSEYPPAKIIQASRDIMNHTIERLANLGPNPSEKARLAVLKQCIESFNQSDAKTHWIETMERDDIYEEFEAIVFACGLRAHKDLADNWREW
jgi:hypothetical protein